MTAILLYIKTPLVEPVSVKTARLPTIVLSTVTGMNTSTTVNAPNVWTIAKRDVYLALIAHFVRIPHARAAPIGWIAPSAHLTLSRSQASVSAITGTSTCQRSTPALPVISPARSAQTISILTASPAILDSTYSTTARYASNTAQLVSRITITVENEKGLTSDSFASHLTKRKLCILQMART